MPKPTRTTPCHACGHMSANHGMSGRCMVQSHAPGHIDHTCPCMRYQPPLVAWDLIGLVPGTHDVRIVGGRARYEQVDYNDETGGRNVRLARLEARPEGLVQVNRYVHPDTAVELVNTHTGAIENAVMEGHLA